MDKKKEKNKTAHKEDKEEQPVKNSHDNSAIYKKDKKTGKWEVRNPAGSFAYNYLYRDELI